MEGSDWVRHRRVINPAFTIDKLKVHAMPSSLSLSLFKKEVRLQYAREQQEQWPCSLHKQIVTESMLDFADSMAGELEAEASQNENGETQVDIYKHFSDLTVDNIAYAIFGSSYKLGKQVFEAQTELLGITMATFLDVPIPGSK